MTRTALELVCSERVVNSGNVAIDLLPSLLVVMEMTPEGGAGASEVVLGSGALRGAAVFRDLPASGGFIGEYLGNYVDSVRQ